MKGELVVDALDEFALLVVPWNFDMDQLEEGSLTDVPLVVGPWVGDPWVDGPMTGDPSDSF